MKIRKSHYRQAPYHAHSTYIQTSNQAIRDQKLIKKGTNNPETKKNYNNNWKSFTKIYAKRVYDSLPHLNLTMFSVGAEEPQPRIKITKQDTNMYKLTDKSKTQSHPIN